MEGKKNIDEAFDQYSWILKLIVVKYNYVNIIDSNIRIKF